MKADKGVKVQRFRDKVQSRKVEEAVIVDIGQLELKLGRITKVALEGSIGAEVYLPGWSELFRKLTVPLTLSAAMVKKGMLGRVLRIGLG